MTRQVWPFLPQLNNNAFDLCQQSIKDEQRLGVIKTSLSGATILDFAVGRRGTIAAGIRLAEICLGGLGTVSIQNSDCLELPLPRVQVTTDWPIEACIASQYAGWPLSQGKYFAMCSGPARMLRGEEDILLDYGLVYRSEHAVGIFEANQIPSLEVVNYFAKSCGIEPSEVCLCVARTASFPGTIQVVARSVETTLHKLHELKFDLSTIKNATGSAPLPPIAGDDLTALGWTNDAILYGGHVNLWVDTVDAAIEKIMERLPSSSSADFGAPFLSIFNRYDKDFYKIDKLLFSPAQVVINNLKTGHTFTCGSVRNDILRASFGF